MRWEVKVQIHCNSEQGFRPLFFWANAISLGLLSILREKFFKLCYQVKHVCGPWARERGLEGFWLNCWDGDLGVEITTVRDSDHVYSAILQRTAHTRRIYARVASAWWTGLLRNNALNNLSVRRCQTPVVFHISVHSNSYIAAEAAVKFGSLFNRKSEHRFSKEQI